MRFLKSSVAAALMLCAGSLLNSSCRQKDDPVAPATTGSLKMEFTNMVGSARMTLNNEWYKNAANDSFRIITYKYYISNIVLHTADGKSYTEPDSYHLINEEDASSYKFRLDKVPVGNYTSVTFLVGVDSLHNSTGAQAGALDPSLGMIWNWNTGYIMAKMEGYANTSPQTDGFFAMHVAGYRGEFNVLKTITLNFPEHADVSGARTPNVHILSDALEWFKNPETITIRDYSNVMTEGKQAYKVATNYADMFTIDHIDN